MSMEDLFWQHPGIMYFGSNNICVGGLGKGYVDGNFYILDFPSQCPLPQTLV